MSPIVGFRLERLSKPPKMFILLAVQLSEFCIPTTFPGCSGSSKLELSCECGDGEPSLGSQDLADIFELEVLARDVSDASLLSFTSLLEGEGGLCGDEVAHDGVLVAFMAPLPLVQGSKRDSALA